MPKDKEQEDISDVPPTENEKKTKKTKTKYKGEVMFGNKKEKVDLIVETTPNATAGYDVVVNLPICPIASVNNK